MHSWAAPLTGPSSCGSGTTFNLCWVSLPPKEQCMTSSGPQSGPLYLGFLTKDSWRSGTCTPACESVWVCCLSLSVSLVLSRSDVKHKLFWPSAWTQSLWYLLPLVWRWSPCCLPHTQTVSWWEMAMETSLSISSRTSAWERAAR